MDRDTDTMTNHWVHYGVYTRLAVRQRGEHKRCRQAFKNDGYLKVIYSCFRSGCISPTLQEVNDSTKQSR